MDIDLTSSEKRSFYSFLALYLGSSFLLLIIALFFYFQGEKTLYIDLEKSNLQNIISKASNEIIVSHMNNSLFIKEKYLENRDFLISFFDKNQKEIFGNLKEKIDLNKSFLYDEKSMILVDNSTVGHQNIWYIAIKSENIKSKIDKLFLNVVLIFLFIYSIISLVGIYLAKLFLKPIKDEQIRLNNFIKDTTHELNTPISAILMSCEDENISKKQLERIKFSAKRVSEIYSDLSYLFLKNSEKKAVQEIELKKIIEDELIEFEPMILRKKLTINLDLEELYYKILNDDFVRLFNNILSNAIKYNRQNGFINITLKNKILVIEDSGIGIDEKSKEDIFKRYFRATNQSGGFGLGLNIVDKICKKYGIKIDIYSLKDRGTSFKLSL